MTDNIEEKEIIKNVQRLVTAMEVVYNKPGIIFWRGFIRGVGYGFGATVGVAIVLLFLSWLASQLGGIPALTEWLNKLSRNLPI